MLIQQLVNGIVVGSTYAIFALGFTLIFGINKVLNMAFGSIFMCSAFAGLYVVRSLGYPFWLSLIVGMAAGGVLSVILDRAAFAPLRKRGAPDFAYVLTSIGASMILLSLAQKLSKTENLRFPFGTFPEVAFELGGVSIQLLQLLIVGVGVLMLLVLMYALFWSSLGRRIRSVAFSADTSQLLGINAELVNLQVFFLAGALVGLAGVLIGAAFNSVYFLMGEPFMMRAFAVIILGGLGSIPGALLGGLAIGIVQSLSYAYISSAAADAIVFAILFLVILVRPTGMFGLESAVVRVQRR